MSPTSLDEQIVRPFTPIPPGYIFVPKGNVYITKNCRKMTQAQNKPIYTVQSDKRKTLGIRVPNSIYSMVLAENKATAATRAENVRRKDQNLEDKTEAEVLSCFPNIPREHIPRILRHTLQKRSRRVGRSREMPLSQVVDLAVRAYIRHRLTDYDAMLRKGVDREQARRSIQGTIDETVVQWGGTVRNAKSRDKNSSGSSRGSSKRIESSPSKPVDSRVRKVNRMHGAKPYTSDSGRRKSIRAGNARKATPRSTEQQLSEVQGQPLTFRPRRTSLRNKNEQISDEKTIIVISDDEDFVDIDSVELEDSDASYHDESDF